MLRETQYMINTIEDNTRVIVEKLGKIVRLLEAEAQAKKAETLPDSGVQGYILNPVCCGSTGSNCCRGTT